VHVLDLEGGSIRLSGFRCTVSHGSAAVDAAGGGANTHGWRSTWLGTVQSIIRALLLAAGRIYIDVVHRQINTAKAGSLYILWFNSLLVPCQQLQGLVQPAQVGPSNTVF
jgi:hypothetical protein